MPGYDDELRISTHVRGSARSRLRRQVLWHRERRIRTRSAALTAPMVCPITRIARPRTNQHGLEWCAAQQVAGKGLFPTVSLRRHYVRLPSETHREGKSKRGWRYLMGVPRLMIAVPGETEHRNQHQLTPRTVSRQPRP